jgi:hypothetical protein
MIDQFIFGYVQACTAGKLPLTECGPVWQLGIIGALLVAAVLTLAVLRIRSRGNVQSGQGAR